MLVGTVYLLHNQRDEEPSLARAWALYAGLLIYSSFMELIDINGLGPGGSYALCSSQLMAHLGEPSRFDTAEHLTRSALCHVVLLHALTSKSSLLMCCRASLCPENGCNPG